MMQIVRSAGVALVMVAGQALTGTASGQSLPPNVERTVVKLEVPCSTETAGSLLAADVEPDGRMELLVTAPGYVGVYGTDGSLRWSVRDDVRVGGQAESEGLPGHHGPGLQVGDVDGDGEAEVLYLTRDSVLHARRGRDGAELWTAKPPVPDGAEAWEMCIILNLRGEGDRDVLLQATNARGYRMGKYLAAYRSEDLRAGRYAPLGETDQFLACAHNGARVADLDGDGRDEILGGTIYSPDGRLIYRYPVEGHLDSVFVYDVRPDLPGLEVVTLEEGGHGENTNRVFLAGMQGLIFQTNYRNWEPQNAAVGRFDPQREGLQIWCRSRFNEHQEPFVFDAQGKLIAAWKMDDVAPEGWTASGVETIWCIDWTGEEAQLAAAKERHRSGDICVFEPLTGRFVVRIAEKADRIYVADILDDWREEMVVWSGDELHVYRNTAPNPRPDEPRLWERQEYRRSKMTWNYYSP